MYPDRPNNNKQKITAGIVALIVIALLGVGASAYNNQQSSQAATTTTPTSTQTAMSSTTSSTSSTSTTSTGSYKDGTYTSSTTYYVPHGSESIKVTLTVKNGVITDSAIENSEGDRESIAYQQDFTSAYKSQVVGKSISGLQLSYVAGASDTTQGFNDSLEKIRTQAQA
ncbi:MAG: hypothetical protein JWN75_1072 [Candidatus Saccharibacteria bacterium]|nr:hypothetical protein [Candidatus Saccharibacteria bacterium]